MNYGYAWKCGDVISYTCVFLEILEIEILYKAYFGTSPALCEWNQTSSYSSAHHWNITFSGSSLTRCIFSLEGVLQHLTFCSGPCSDFHLVFYAMKSAYMCANYSPDKNTLQILTDFPLAWKHFLFKTHYFEWHILSPVCCCRAVLVFISCPSLSLSLCLWVSDITRHQVCTGGLREAIQTNHRPWFLSEENKPSRWDTFIIFWECSLVHRLSTDTRVAQARSGGLHTCLFNIILDDCI